MYVCMCEGDMEAETLSRANEDMIANETTKVWKD